MKKILLGSLIATSLLFGGEVKEVDLGQYLTKFDMQERTNIKANIAFLLKMLKEDKAVFIDIRSREEVASWSFGFAKNIPLNELPNRLDELPKDKLIITACPHYDRSSMARLYLTTKGYNAKYLSDGLLKLADYLRGDNAVAFQNELKK